MSRCASHPEVPRNEALTRAVLPAHYKMPVALVSPAVDLEQPQAFPRHAGSFRINRTAMEIVVDPLYGSMFGVRPVETIENNRWVPAEFHHALDRDFQVSLSHPALVEPVEGAQFAFMASSRFPSFAEGFPGVEHVIAILSGPETPQRDLLKLNEEQLLLMDPVTRDGYVYRKQRVLWSKSKVRSLQNPWSLETFQASEDLSEARGPDSTTWTLVEKFFTGPKLCDIRRPHLISWPETKGLRGRYVDAISVPSHVRRHVQKDVAHTHFELDPKPFLVVSSDDRLHVAQILLDSSGTGAFDVTTNELDRARAFHHQARQPKRLPVVSRGTPPPAVRCPSVSESFTSESFTLESCSHGGTLESCSHGGTLESYSSVDTVTKSTDDFSDSYFSEYEPSTCFSSSNIGDQPYGACA